MERLSVLYATALFDLALHRDLADDFMDQATFIMDTLQDTQCQRILLHPHIPTAEKQEFFKKAFSRHVHADLLGFLYLAAEKNRETYLLPALTALVDMIRRHKGKVTAIVYFAAAINEGQLAVMSEVLSRKLKKSVDVSLKVDASVIGGPYIFVDGYYLDWTVKKRLRDLTVHMKEGCSA